MNLFLQIFEEHASTLPENVRCSFKSWLEQYKELIERHGQQAAISDQSIKSIVAKASREELDQFITILGLSRTEAKMFSVLLAHRGYFVRTNELIFELWSDEVLIEGDSRRIYVRYLIFQIRKKLDDLSVQDKEKLPFQFKIQTLRSFGYGLMAI